MPNVGYTILYIEFLNAMMKSAADIRERTENDRFAETVRVTIGMAFRFGAAEVKTLTLIASDDRPALREKVHR